MKRVRFLPLVLMSLATFMAGAATPSDQVPPVFQSLIPKGYRLVSPGFTKNAQSSGGMTIGMAGVNFAASKESKGRHAQLDIEYSFDLFLYQMPEAMMQMQGKRYRQAFPADVESVRQGCLSHESDAVIGYDTLKETTYAWGWGITQRRLHHYVGAGAAPDDIDYTGEYRGLIFSNNTVKKFKLSVVGARTSAEAGQWAAAAADKIAKTGFSDIN